MSGAARLEASLFGLAALFLGLAQDWGALLPGFEPAPRTDAELRVVSWNLGGASGGEPHGFQEESLESVVQTLRACAADLVFLQEIGDEELLARLVGELGSDWNLVRGRGGVAALSARGQLERWPVPLARSLGVHLWIGGCSIAAATLHSSAFSARDRNREIGPTLDALLEQQAELHLFTGDLNLDLDLDKRCDLFSNDLHLDVETYNYVAQHLADAARGSGPTAEPDRRLDYVFATPSVPVRAAGPWRGRRTGTMDHDPLVVDLEL